MICENCQSALSGRQTRFCSKKCQNAILNNWFQSYELQKARGLRRKIEFVQKLGGKCSCGYDKNLGALEFHHLRDKSFMLDLRAFGNRSRKSLENEVKKCELKCANCHREEHHPELNGWQMAVSSNG